ncbi:hypothetical protein IPA_01245 [Ignicoccus pacificus DSM 13166]|uniref:Uncharacterized protein n=1 Tax=Ignicoccus pacificus DSM 13166 TaxID=940294 RepID=A0A977KAG5_9CREN|nr:hypothetical protein IPA_01245 [Ignicoccus pacificus DSM 13166]
MSKDNQYNFEFVSNFLKTALGKFIFGVPDEIITTRDGTNLLIYRTEENLMPSLIQLARKYGADGVELHLTLPQGKPPERIHVSFYVYKCVKGSKICQRVIPVYILDEKSTEGYVRLFSDINTLERKIKTSCERLLENIAKGVSSRHMKKCGKCK